MRASMLLLAGSLTLGLAAEAAAGPGQCFWPNGQPVGPLYDTDSPNYNWLQWAQRRGLNCRRVGAGEAHGLRNRPQGFPGEYSAAGPDYRPPGYQQPGYRPPGYQPPGYQPPGYRPPAGYDESDTVWRGDAGRAAYLAGRWLANQGRPYAQVVDTGRVEVLYDRQWRIFFARWADGSRARVAVRFSRREGGSYIAMQSYGGGAWAQPQPIGQ